MLPNVIGPLLILASMDIPGVITLEAGLSFLGLGVPPPAPSWGRMLSEGYNFIRDTPWIVVGGSLPLILHHPRLHLPGRRAARCARPACEARPMSATTDELLGVEDLSVSFAGEGGRVQALRHVSLTVRRGSIMGIVGESGSGKSTLIAAATQFLAANASVSGRVRFDGRDLLGLDARSLRALRGRRIAMVFQDPMTALNPVLSIGRQMVDIQYRDAGSATAKRARAAEMLKRVGIPDAASRLNRYPYEFSGGMRQRVAIAMALLGNPDLLIADEPTTALDVTMEAQIIHLLRVLRREFQGSILFVSHNLGLIAELCDEVTILYAGEVMESGPVREIMQRPRHPYTRGLLDCDPARISGAVRTLPTIGGEVPDLVAPPPGCVFSPRCALAEPVCLTPPERRCLGPGHVVRCHKAVP